MTLHFVRELEAKGYREDRAARRRFERPYSWVTIPGILLCFGSYPFTHYVLAPRYPAWDWMAIFIVSILVGFAMVFVASWHCLRAFPTSQISGKKLDRYECTDPVRGRDYRYYVYADHDGKIYFVRPIQLGKSTS